MPLGESVKPRSDLLSSLRGRKAIQLYWISSQPGEQFAQCFSIGCGLFLFQEAQLRAFLGGAIASDVTARCWTFLLQRSTLNFRHFLAF